MSVYMGETARISESALAGLHLGRHKAQREWSLVSEFLSCHWLFNTKGLRSTYFHFQEAWEHSRLLFNESPFETDGDVGQLLCMQFFSKSFKEWRVKPIQFSSQHFSFLLFFFVVRLYKKVWVYRHDKDKGYHVKEETGQKIKKHYGN